MSTRDGQIQLSADFLAGNWPRPDEARMAVTGLLFHEVARVWQYDGEGHASTALLDGIDDLVRLRGGYQPEDWVQPGQGGRWDEKGYGVTARFLEHLEKQRPGLVAAMNVGLKTQVPNGGIDLFKRITGKSVAELWAQYKAAYAA
ncbi:hypothetical protein EJB05_22992 [Eragrostis curvula]|uniref:Uncharacterized protein n=1 Tax=Eragrostis curvula TaxID=38414 RepID=A0A5J9V8V6_9POAL|nr:hypothetical protein EJB05_22992 [Eragrostis curvula]